MSGQKRLPIQVGFQTGALTVEEATENRKDGYRIWKCRCNCGGTILLDTRCLQRGTVKDCGCITRVKPGQLDLTGQQFGRLLCVNPSDRRDSGGNMIWNCICDCGNQCQASSNQLRSGNKKSCGCLSHPKRKDLIGERFGKLVVTDYHGKRDGMHRWKCKCDCGRDTVVGQTLLQSGKTKSCGCLQGAIVLENLKLYQGTSVTFLEATKKRRIASNTSGYTGVYQKKKTGKWVAQITFQRRTYYLGIFDHKEDAIKARQEGEKMHDTFLEWYYSTNRNNEKQDKKIPPGNNNSGGDNVEG